MSTSLLNLMTSSLSDNNISSKNLSNLGKEFSLTVEQLMDKENLFTSLSNFKNKNRYLE